jgi:uncharacterized flavoprotein (TIGR03862 family)
MTDDAAAVHAAARRTVAVIGGGPAGLMVAERLAADYDVTLFERMPGVGRKFLMAGRGGLNLTHGEAHGVFVARYREAAPRLAPMLEEFPPATLRDWCEGLGQPTFVGSSGRIFPVAMKASPLLRAWLRRLDALGVRFALGQTWRGWEADGALRFCDQAGDIRIHRADATVLALGGASWPRLGADGGWVGILRAAGIAVADLAPSNCGIHVAWTPHLVAAFAGAPLKRIALSAGGERVRGEAVITARGLEGGAVYALSGPLRAALAARGRASLEVDLRPDLETDALAAKLRAARRGARSLASFLRSAASLPQAAIALLREVHGRALPEEPSRLAAAIKTVSLDVTGLAPIDRAISSAGGIAWDELDAQLMLSRLPGVFACGEMIDWDAPTGGYLLQACFATAHRAAAGTHGFLRAATKTPP